MALAPLAAVADMTARGITVTNPALAELYLQVASEAVRDAAGCSISRTTGTVTVVADGGTRLVLPGSPIVSVAAVEIDGQAVTGWVLRPGGLWRAAGWQKNCQPTPVQVTYTQGLDPVPADIVDLVCRMANTAVLAAQAAADGSGLALGDVVSERLGDYSVTYRADSGATEMELTERTRDRLAARFGAGTAVVGMW